MSLKTTQWVNVSVGILDVFLMAGLTFIVDGFDSPLYWVFAVLILHNALAIPLALPQLLLNLLVTLGYVAGGVLDMTLISGDKFSMPPVAAFFGSLLHQKLLIGDPSVEPRTENPYERVLVLVVWAACCYGIQVLFEKQKRAEAEATEFAVRQERLRTAGRLAAEIAHKIKNPLGIITNAAFCLQRAVNDGEFAVEEQIAIIREEVSHADQILTVLMGYAQLAEGRVERLEVAAEIDNAILQVFPPAAKYEVRIKRYYSSDLRRRPHAKTAPLQRPGQFAAKRPRSPGRPRAKSKSPPATASTIPSSLPSPTTARAFPPTRSTRSSRPISPPAPKAPAWAWPSSNITPKCTAAPSRCNPSLEKAPASP